MRTLFSFLVLGFAFSLFSACEETIELDLPDHDPKPVFLGAIQTDQTWEFQVFWSQGLDENIGQSTRSGDWLILYGDGQVLDTFRHVQGCFCPTGPLAGTFPQPNVLYEVSGRSILGLENFRASTLMPSKIDPVLVQDSLQISGDSVTYFSDVELSLSDPPGKNFYYLGLAITDTLTNQRVGPQLEFSDPSLDAEYLRTFFGADGFIFKDNGFSDQEKELKFRYSFESESPNPHLKRTLVFAHVNEDHYRYALSYKLHAETQSDPFAEPVQLYSNVEGGFGIFSGMYIWKTDL